MNVIEELEKLYKDTLNVAAYSIEPLPGAGSNRHYFRIRSTDGKSVIGVHGTDLRENNAFIYLDRCFLKEGINVPEVLAHSADRHYYLLQDLGDTSLYSLLATLAGCHFMNQAIATLPSLQCAKGIDWSNPVLQKPFSERGIMADLNYFKYCFLKPSGIEVDEEALQDDFEKFCKDVTVAGSHLEGIMYRDCQSRNIMIHDDKIWWIDFQGARRGPMLYDVVSMLWQAKAGLTDSRRKELLDIYFSALAPLRDYPEKYRKSDIIIFALLRTLQVLGAYGFRGLIEHKAHFITSIPPALANLSSLIEKGASDRYPILLKALSALCEKKEHFAAPADGLLHVEVFSFSYKKGYPQDFSGNGGGFMFDCRALHNPGRYDKYKSLTGMDHPVIEFLENRNEVKSFLEAAMSLCDSSVERYISRGFTHLQIGFGCTGGQHRSVYCAERVARHLKEKFGSEIFLTLHHREQGKNKQL